MSPPKVTEMVSVLEKMPPQSLEAEMALLGAMIRNNSAIGEVTEIVDERDFYRFSHQIIYNILINLFDTRKPIDVVTLKEELEKKGKLEDIGGAEYLVMLHEAVPNVANAVHYANAVREKAILRHLLETFDEVRRLIEEETQDAEILVDEAERKIFEAVKRKAKKGGLKIGDILSQVFHKMDDVRDRKSRLMGLPTDFRELDDLTSGLQPSQFIVIAGRPGMGKTSFAIGMAERVGLEQKKPTLFFSLEMTGEQIAQVMLCSHCRISSHKIRSGFTSEEEFQRLLIGAGKFQEAPIFIDDNSDLSIIDLRARARRYKAEHKVELIMIDYLQLLHTTDRRISNREQEIALISRQLKALAKELEVPVIALAQLNRSPEKEDRKPRLSDLRESGAIEQDADLVLLLNREEVYNPETDEKNVCEVIVAKNRTGPVGQVKLTFLKDYMRFERLAQSP